MFLLPEGSKLSRTPRLVKIKPIFDQNQQTNHWLQKQKPEQEPETKLIQPYLGLISKQLSVPKSTKLNNFMEP